MTNPQATALKALNELPWRATPEGVRLFVRLTPKGGRDAIEGSERRDDDKCYLKARVRAAPDNGAANAALLKLLAKTLRLPSSAVILEAGHTARIKTCFFKGNPEQLTHLLEAYL